jgi:hypothetical protein
VWRIGVESESPPEKGGRLIDRPTEQFEPWRSELGLEAEAPCRNFRGCPDEDQHDETDEDDLVPEDPCCIHGNGESESRASIASEKWQCAGRGYGRPRIGRIRHCIDCSRRPCDAMGATLFKHAEGATFFFAGIWSEWEGDGPQEERTQASTNSSRFL